MINVIYLVIVFTIGDSSAVTIPQANMNQCMTNRKNYIKDTQNIHSIYCISGVVPNKK